MFHRRIPSLSTSLAAIFDCGTAFALKEAMNRRFLFALFASASLTTGIASTARAEFPAKTFVGGVSIAGLNQNEATRRIKRELAPKLERSVALTAGTKIVYRRRRDLGFSLDIGKMLARAKSNRRVSTEFRVDRAKAKTALSRLQKNLSSQSREARPIYFSHRVQIRPSQIGKKLNVSDSAARLEILGERKAETTRFHLVSNSIAPKITTDRLKGINAILGTYSTRFNSGLVKRTGNVKIAAKSIDGTLLSPNEVFSLNKTVGNRTQARGYRTAIIFENGKKIPGLGGGVSQVTGTIFNAALVAGLPIVTYHTHSRPVTYIPLGRDATVSWGNFDMKFKNDTGAPIYISYKVTGNRLSATLFGKRTGRTTKISVSSKRKGPRDITANLYRVIYKNGKFQERKKIGSSHYNWKADNEE